VAVLKGCVPGELHTVLTAFMAYDRETTGHALKGVALGLADAEQFVDSDREFQA